MKLLEGRKINLGICGGIAAYKIPWLVRLLKQSGAEVQVIMTPSASDYVSEKTLSVLSNRPVWTHFFNDQGMWNHHVDAGIRADLMVIVPATANTIAKMAHGICDNLLLTVYYSSRCPVMVFPAMDLEMYAHPSVKENLEKLKQRGNLIIPAEKGPLASGLSGEGRMPEPETIFSKIRTFFSEKGPLKGKKVLVNAGPTYEPLDAVRFIGNYSSGKMGIALADALADSGAEVCLVCGPVKILPQNERVRTIRVDRTSEMYEAMLKEFEQSDIIVCAAAVSDFAPQQTLHGKLKKEDYPDLNIHLKNTTDILLELGKIKKNKQLLVGFALETDSVLENGKKKLKRKNADLLVINPALQEDKTVFDSDENTCVVIDRFGKQHPFERMSKVSLAYRLTDLFLEYYHAL